MTTFVFASLLLWLLIGVGGWLGYQFVRQNGRMLLRLDSIERRLAARGGPGSGQKGREPTGLPVGTAVPDLDLPDLAGDRHKLSEFRGRDVLLIFFNPQCGFCSRMAADLAALQIDSENGRAVPLVVTTGDGDDNRTLVEQHGIRCTLLLQEQIEVASHFGVQGTPMGYRINAEGRIASELTVGAEPLLRLASAQIEQVPAGPAHGAKSKHKEPDPSLDRSRLNRSGLDRSGLKAGALAPEFQLSQIDGGELALTALRGRRVLLVFSDPDCGPCDELAPQLQELHDAESGLQVLVISRRDAEATRAKAARLGLTYPIVMQKQWELSMKYGMFATPIGYLIDEHGVLVSDVAVGVESILKLSTDASVRTAFDQLSESNRQLLTAS